MNDAFKAGARAGMLKVAMEDKEAFSFAPIAAGARRALTRAQPFLAHHAAPAIQAAQSGAAMGPMSAFTSGVSSLIGTGGRALATAGRPGVAANPLKKRLGGIMQTVAPMAQAFG